VDWTVLRSCNARMDRCPSQLIDGGRHGIEALRSPWHRVAAHYMPWDMPWGCRGCITDRVDYGETWRRPGPRAAESICRH
jgi:hypothetical protein